MSRLGIAPFLEYPDSVVGVPLVIKAEQQDEFPGISERGKVETRPLVSLE